MDCPAFATGLAVITGSASGLGYALAVECWRKGMHVILADIRSSVLDRAVQKLQATVSNEHPLFLN
jgi:short-subunit dehydrogenase